MTLILFGIVLPVACAIVGALAYHEGKCHAEEDAAADYSRAHGDGFENGWNANEEVHRAMNRVLNKANW